MLLSFNCGNRWFTFCGYISLLIKDTGYGHFQKNVQKRRYFCDPPKGDRKRCFLKNALLLFANILVFGFQTLTQPKRALS